MTDIPLEVDPYHGRAPDINLATGAAHVQANDAPDANVPIIDDLADIYINILDELGAATPTQSVDNLYDCIELPSF